MARPKPDTDKIRSRLIAEAEAQLEETDGRRLVLSDLAERVGMSQSHVHTFFPTKADLIRELAARWFDAVETASADAASADAPPDARLEQWVLSILRIKRDRFDANPKLFRAYLELAGAHMDLVQSHAAALRADLARILRDLVGAQDADHAVPLVENATLLFRTPQNIAAYRARATDEAARAICHLLTRSLARSKGT
ncbi:putative regulatory protein TetR [Dinoroseobacter shibae DFL 12 = DSM 16493]|jgi:AcrR family transcriptional regulator|uniref:Putative regulatory protein TetR n=1 Tax=Dinoroseobacter shibae (strain DSM 16493 / NCIMB 14021 / DFL 12) TaxID=398580 RepID=A8LR13_DINSH|nr:TetR family transcriptional regulator [Dinoroseobacter shibae]ABV93936.1 putative regulatory protein TetR [Dinoroseobacter shibae DFL 12 = DSM 16493]URF45381.1 TetR family transcriptional regulator [Dinoroseobacter shibae]URF49686.1 TetR family transcriptional regulator [Dinoroseobacter shibae]